MGFGILIAGYYTTYLIGMLMKSEWYGAAIMLCGYFLMASALMRLTEYEMRFRNALYFETFLICYEIYHLLAVLDGAFLWGNPVFSGTIAAAMQYVEILLFLAFHVFLLLAIRRLASDVDLPKVMSASVRNIVVLGTYTALAIFLRLPIPFVKENGGYFVGASMLLQMLFYLLMAVLLLSCYMRISDESDVDMPTKKSRFAWVNRMREARDEREQRAIDSTRAYAEEKIRKRRESREEYLRAHGNGKPRRQRKKKR